MKYDISFETLLSLCDGKIQIKPAKQPGPVKGAFNGGKYLGSPGKDIYFSLSNLTPQQFNQLIEQHSTQYPTNPPSNHVGNAACIRYIYGQFEKQGVLRSKSDRKRMEQEEIDWSLARKFIFALKNKFEEKNHFYGLTLIHEMEAHRLGDEAYLKKDKEKLDEMEQTYLEAVYCAHKCGSGKHMFTPYYWAAKYFILLEDRERALYYSKKTIIEAEQHCPDARGSYIDKLLDCAKYIRSDNKGKWKKWREKISSNAKNRVTKKMLQKI